MPYIPQAERDKIIVGDIAGMTAGQLNYMITQMIRQWIGEPSYTKIATATGVLENVKQEMYRRLASPYEDKKIEENGDVY